LAINQNLTPNFECPTRTKIFYGFLPFQHQYHPTFKLKHNIFESSFCPARKMMLKIFSVICILFFHMSLLMQYIFRKTFYDICSVTYFRKVMQTTTLSSVQYIFLSLSHAHMNARAHTHHPVHLLFITGNMNEHTPQLHHFLR
jgi:hypothetical protein